MHELFDEKKSLSIPWLRVPYWRKEPCNFALFCSLGKPWLVLDSILMLFALFTDSSIAISGFFFFVFSFFSDEIIPTEMYPFPYYIFFFRCFRFCAAHSRYCREINWFVNNTRAPNHRIYWNKNFQRSDEVVATACIMWETKCEMLISWLYGTDRDWIFCAPGCCGLFAHSTERERSRAC